MSAAGDERAQSSHRKTGAKVVFHDEVGKHRIGGSGVLPIGARQT
jgi:hypothetical protein